MLTRPQNKNLSFHTSSRFDGFPVQVEKGPLIKQYLASALRVISASLGQHGRVFAFRLDLRFPSDFYAHPEDNSVLERFFASFKAKIRHNRSVARMNNPNAHDSSVRYIWCREYGEHGIPHYHVAILLNHDAFFTLGQYETGRDNLYNRINEAWASALGMPTGLATGQVHFPDNATYQLRRDDPDTINDFLYRVSYLCKVETKRYGTGTHGFGASRG